MKKHKAKRIEVVSQYAYDIEGELTKMLSEQLAKEIDKDIIRILGYEPDRRIRRKNKIDKLLKK